MLVGRVRQSGERQRVQDALPQAGAIRWLNRGVLRSEQRTGDQELETRDYGRWTRDQETRDQEPETRAYGAWRVKWAARQESATVSP